VASVAAKKSAAGETPGRRERNKLIKRERIVRAARDLFHKQGFAETTTQQVAAAADIGTGTLFLYARSKEDLLVMVFKDEMLENVQAIFATLPADASPTDQLMHVFNRMADYHARDLDLSRVLLKELVIPSSTERIGEISELMRAILGGIASIVDGRVAGQPALTAQSAFALYYFALLGWLGSRFERNSSMRLLREQLDQLLGAGA
jgi:AcrR family transcriptional regulator